VPAYFSSILTRKSIGILSSILTRLDAPKEHFDTFSSTTITTIVHCTMSSSSQKASSEVPKQQKPRAASVNINQLLCASAPSLRVSTRAAATAHSDSDDSSFAEPDDADDADDDSDSDSDSGGEAEFIQEIPAALGHADAVNAIHTLMGLHTAAVDSKLSRKRKVRSNTGGKGKQKRSNLIPSDPMQIAQQQRVRENPDAPLAVRNGILHCNACNCAVALKRYGLCMSCTWRVLIYALLTVNPKMLLADGCLVLVGLLCGSI